jgi:hypothetical protein
MVRYNAFMAPENQSDNSLPDSVLVTDGHRVELHILPLADDSYFFVALAGGEAEPDRIKGQGPFADRSIAAAVVHQVAGTLVARGYRRVDEPLRWQLAAWRYRREVVQEREGTPLRKTFHPDDVLR